MANHQIDDKIREALAGDDEVRVSGDLFVRIKLGAEACEIKKFDQKVSLWIFDSRRKLLVSLFGFLVLFVIFGMCFENVRVMAVDVIDKIKTIFVLETTGDKYQIVEKPANKVRQNIMVSNRTDLSDSALSQKVGYKVYFPKTLDAGYTLYDKALSVVLRKPVDYNLALQLQNSMSKAIQDDKELKKLKKYNQKRQVFGTYRNKNGFIIFIYITNSSDYREALENMQYKTVNIGNVKGKWAQYPIADYTVKTENNIRSSDFSQKPTNIRISHSLYWESGGLNFILYFHNGNELPMEVALKFAESFMEKQK